MRISDWSSDVCSSDLIPIGTEARTGLLCIMLLALLMLLHMKRRVLYGALMAFAVIVSIPFLPASFTNRMDTIENYKSDESASTRLAVWKRSEEGCVGKECVSKC